MYCTLFRLQQIVDLDEKNQILTSNIWLNIDWEDYSMLWNSTEYNGVEDVRYIEYFRVEEVRYTEYIRVEKVRYTEYQVRKGQVYRVSG